MATLLPDVPRFFCAALPHPRLTGQRCVLDESESRHAKRVLRLSAGAAIELFDGHGGLAQAELESYQSGLAVCRIVNMAVHPRVEPLVTLATAIPKGGRADDMVQQLSQAGVDRLIPLQSHRSSVTPRQAKLDRFARQAVESAKQCGRLFIMELTPPQPLEAVLAMEADLKLLADPRGDTPADLPQRLQEARHVLVLVGPEGGWTPPERLAATTANCLLWSMGPYVLRVETAATAAAVLVRYLAGR